MKHEPKHRPKEPRRPAGNAVFDEAEQSCREDLPEGTQEECAEPARGTAPPQGAEAPRARLDEEDFRRAKGSPPAKNVEEREP